MYEKPQDEVLQLFQTHGSVTRFLHFPQKTQNQKRLSQTCTLLFRLLQLPGTVSSLIPPSSPNHWVLSPPSTPSTNLSWPHQPKVLAAISSIKKKKISLAKCNVLSVIICCLFCTVTYIFCIFCCLTNVCLINQMFVLLSDPALWQQNHVFYIFISPLTFNIVLHSGGYPIHILLND